MPTIATGFRKRFIDGAHLLGTFVKTPAPHPVEVLAGAGLDFVVLDEEHAPWDRCTLDMALLAARASNIAGIVRVAEATASRVLSVLDDGATGVLVPHVSSADHAAKIAAAMRYRGGRRGFSNTTRAGGFGTRGLWDHVDHADAAVTLIAMIEDPEALEDIDAILATPGLDGVFIGRGDLTVAMGAPDMGAPQIVAACKTIFAAARRAAKPVAVMVADGPEAQRFAALGASTFIVASDQGFMRQAALKARSDVFAALDT